jgi:hypothetical protein
MTISNGQGYFSDLQREICPLPGETRRDRDNQFQSDVKVRYLACVVACSCHKEKMVEIIP